MRSEGLHSMLDNNHRHEPVLRITHSLSFKSALALIDVRVLDHLVVGQSEVVSLAERGLL